MIRKPSQARARPSPSFPMVDRELEQPRVSSKPNTRKATPLDRKNPITRGR